MTSRDRRRFLGACALLLGAPALAAPARPGGARATLQALEAAQLKSIAAWLRASGRDGYLSGDVADVAGIPRRPAEDLLEAKQRGFQSGDVLRIAQVPAQGELAFLLFMVQRPQGEVYFYLCTTGEGLRKAFVSIPRQGAVHALQAAEARSGFEREVRYWQARIAGS